MLNIKGKGIYSPKSSNRYPNDIKIKILKPPDVKSNSISNDSFKTPKID